MVIDQTKDPLMRILAAAGVLTILGGIIYYGPIDGLYDGLAVIFTTILLIAITAGNDYMKDRQFNKLISSVRDEEVAVARGKEGFTKSVNVFDLVVGDVILLETGTRVPADCILVEGTDLKVNEQYYHPQKTRDIREKRVCTEENFNDNPDPFIYTQSLVENGYGKAVVCAVGPHSCRGKDKAEGLAGNEEQTPLQERLDNVGTQLSKYAILGALAILAICLINYVIQLVFVDHVSLISAFTFQSFIGYVTIAVAMMIVSMPEGLPLAISISLAYSVMRMKDDKILVKNLTAPEKMGGMDVICTGKTGTLTKGDMKVMAFYAQSQ